MSFTTYIKTVLLSGLFIGASFASAPAPSPYAKPFDSTSLHSQPSPLAMAGTAGVNALGIGSGACPERSEGADAASSTVPFERTAHGLVFPCPKIAADQSTAQKMQEIVAKIKSDTLTQDDATLKSLTSGAFSGLGECRCKYYERSKGDRAKFENKLVDMHRTKLDKPFTYISYASGLLFQDLVITTKLIQAGCKDITLICIDLEYSEFREAFKDAQALSHREGDEGAVQINNALYVCATYFSLLKNLYPDLSITLKVYATTAQAMQDTKPQSVQLIYTIDFGAVHEKITEKLKFSIHRQLAKQMPQMDNPYYEDSQTDCYLLQDFFVLGDALLMQRGIKMVVAVETIAGETKPAIDIGHHYAFKNITASLNRTMQKGREKLLLAINNRYGFLRHGNNFVVKGLIKEEMLQMLDEKECLFLDDVFAGKIALEESHVRVLEKWLKTSGIIKE